MGQFLSRIQGTNMTPVPSRSTSQENVQTHHKPCSNSFTYDVKKEVEFAVRANMNFSGLEFENIPVPGMAIPFRKQDCLHITEKYDNEWWIGRLIKEGSAFGFIPSPLKFGMHIDRISRSSRISRYLSAVFLPVTWKRVQAGVRQPAERPYNVIPAMRPIVLIGPSLRGHVLTDTLHKDVIRFLKNRFRGRIIVTTATRSLTFAMRSMENPPPEVLQEVGRVFDLASKLQLVVLDCDTLNYPEQIKDTCLDPIIIYLKVTSIKNLKKLIKCDERSRAKVYIQLTAAKRLHDCPEDMFDIILSECNIEDACEYLATELEAYWEATHSIGPQQDRRAGDP